MNQGESFRDQGWQLGDKVRFVDDPPCATRTIISDEQLDYKHIFSWIWVSDKYGRTRVPKTRAAYNDLREAIRAGDMGAINDAWDRYEPWADYIFDARHTGKES